MREPSITWIDGQAYAPNCKEVIAMKKSLTKLDKAIDSGAIASPCNPDSQTSPRKPKPRLRQSQRPLMNGLESEWHGTVMCSEAKHVRAQSLTFRLANGLRFTPDTTYQLNGQPCADEVKGPYAREDSTIKLKMAANLYPEWRWRLVYKRDGQWVTETILP